MGFLGSRKSTLQGVEDVGPSGRSLLVACAPITRPHLQSLADTCPCKYISMSISADVYSATRSSCASVWADPQDLSTEGWKAGRCGNPSPEKQNAFLSHFSQGSPLTCRWSMLCSCAERGGRRRGGEHRHSLQFIESDSGHALF